MPERSFGRTVRYRRTKLGLSQAKLGELVGRSVRTIRSWEKDASHPTDPAVISTLSAVLDFDERALFQKAGLELPKPEEVEEPTVEQALASLTPEDSDPVIGLEPESVIELKPEPDLDAESKIEEEPELEVDLTDEAAEEEPEPGATSGRIEPIYPYSTELLTTTQTQTIVEPSYMEDRVQRQMYRVRYLATVVILVGLVVVLLWSYTNAFDALSSWWDEFWGSLRL